MNIHKLEIKSVTSTQPTAKVASSGASLRVRSDLKAGAYERPTR